MADNVTLPGTGDVVAADDCGGAGKVQLVKLAYSADGDATTIGATSSGLSMQGQVAHDGAIQGNPVVVGARASVAAPSDVSADNDAVRLWAMRNGALAVNLTAAGALIPGDATNGLKVQPSGNVAHDGADSGNPVKIGAKAATTLSDDTMVADGDRVNAVADLDGAQITRSMPFGDMLSERVTNTNGTSTDLTTFGATSGARNVIKAIVICNNSNTFATVDFRDGAAGSVFLTLPVPPNGGCIFPIPDPGLKQPTANTALAFDVSGAVSTITISIVGCKTKA